MKWFFLAFLLVPIFEIYFLIVVGGAIGAGWTIALVVLTAVAGAKLVSAQGLATLKRAGAQMEAGRPPAMEMLEGLALFFAGALLLTPGFFTDAVGFALLAPRLRRQLIKRALVSGAFSAGRYDGHGARDAHGHGGHGGHGAGPGRIIDADYEKKD